MNLQVRYDLEIEMDRLGGGLDEIQPLPATGCRSVTPTGRSA